MEHSIIQNKFYKNSQTPQFSKKGKHKVNHNSNSLNNMNTSIPRNSEKGALEGAQALYKCYDTHGRPKHFELKGNNFKYISNSVQVPQDITFCQHESGGRSKQGGSVHSL